MDKNKIIGLIVIVGLAYLVYTMMTAGGNTWTDAGCYKDGAAVDVAETECTGDAGEWQAGSCKDADGNVIEGVADAEACASAEAPADNAEGEGNQE